MSDRAGGIHADLGELNQFAAFLEKETADNLDVHTNKVWSTGRGPFPFGTALPGEAMQQVRARYGTCYAETAKALNGYVSASQILVHAIKEIVEYYGGTDALSTNHIGKVQAALAYAAGEAVKAERAAEREALAAASEAETARETTRGNR